MIKDNNTPNITFSGNITVNGPMFDIHDNEHVHIGSPLSECFGKLKSITEEKCEDGGEELFHFVHPEIEDGEAWRIHNAVKRLVSNHGIPEICEYLYQMSREDRILLPKMPSVAYVELVRMGMPTGKGFSEKYFNKYYRQ